MLKCVLATLLATVGFAQYDSLHAQGWVRLNTGVDWGFDKLYVQNKDTVYVTSYGILRTTDGGVTWVSLAGLPEEASEFGFKMIQFVDDTTAYLLPRSVVPNNILFKTTNGGATWQGHETGLPSRSTIGMVFTTRDSGNVAGGGVSRTTDGGQTWEPHDVGASNNAMEFADSRQGYLIGKVTSWPPHPGWQAPTFSRTTDGGASWTEVFTGPTPTSTHSGLYRDVLALSVLPNGTLVAVGDASIARSTDRGDTWDTLVTGTSFEAFIGVHFPDNLHGTVVGSNGWILHSTDGGVSWARQNSGVSEWLTSVLFLDSVNGYVCGDHGLILKTSNGGQSWVNMSPGRTNALNVSCYPSPARDETLVSYRLETVDRISLSIVDGQGKTEMTVADHDVQSAGPHTVRLDLSGLPSGAYTVHISGAHTRGAAKLAILR